MALEAQQNWEVSMAQPFKVMPQRIMTPEPKAVEDHRVYNRIEAPLPVEIILEILSYVPPNAQKTFHSCCLVSRAWYFAAVPMLYKMPYLTGANFQEFVMTVCPSKNAHIRQSALAGFVKKLDMGMLVHDGSKSLTARILGRLKGNLTDFTAPQASFSVNSFAALSKCASLTSLNLSLMSAAIPVKTLFHALQALTQLETLFFPRTSTHDMVKDDTSYAWPPKLKALHLAGGIDNFFLRVNVGNVPSTLERLSIQHCSMIYPDALIETLEKIGPRLRHLTLTHPMNRLYQGALDGVLFWCPNLTALRVSADYITRDFLEKPNVFEDHPLQILDLDCSPNAGASVGLDPEAVWAAIDEGLLPELRSVRVNARLAWTATETLKESMEDVNDLMIALEEEKPVGVRAGVWIIAG